MAAIAPPPPPPTVSPPPNRTAAIRPSPRQSIWLTGVTGAAGCATLCCTASVVASMRDSLPSRLGHLSRHHPSRSCRQSRSVTVSVSRSRETACRLVRSSVASLPVLLRSCSIDCSQARTRSSRSRTLRSSRSSASALTALPTRRCSRSGYRHPCACWPPHCPSCLRSSGSAPRQGGPTAPALCAGRPVDRLACGQ